jgi:enamine deaminase RidA (YjgF/YER057c/UK114 family)
MITRIESGKRMSQAVAANGFVFLAGQVANRPSREVEDQTRQVLAQIDDLLAKAVSATVYLTDIEDFATMNVAWDEWVHPEAKPARATVEAQLATPTLKVEIQVVAVL